MSQVQNKNVRKLKNIVHIAVHFPTGTSKICNKHFENVQDKVSVKLGVQNSCRYLSAQLEHSSNV